MRPFLTLWTLAMMAAVAAFVLHLALRGRIMSLGVKLGDARTERSKRLEERRVLELEAASYKTPERVEFVARTLLGMEAPTPDRIIQLPSPGPPRITADARPRVPRPPREQAQNQESAADGLRAGHNDPPPKTADAKEARP